MDVDDRVRLLRARASECRSGSGSERAVLSFATLSLIVIFGGQGKVKVREKSRLFLA